MYLVFAFVPHLNVSLFVLLCVSLCLFVLICAYLCLFVPICAYLYTVPQKSPNFSNSEAFLGNKFITEVFLLFWVLLIRTLVL